jgi:mannan polymerase complexes MNN9 subunit
MNNVTTSRDPIGNQETVLILTPLARFYQEYWDNLLSLSYPHELISLGFILPKTKEGNAATAALQAAIAKTQSGAQKKRFASITILRQDTESPLSSQAESERHKIENQKMRRGAMAKARNSLLFTTMGPTTSWVLWLDGDIIETPESLIQDLAAHDKPIIAPNCFQRYYNEDAKERDVRGYDFNNWVDSPTAKEMGARMGNDDILLEGYESMPTYRSLMAKMRDEGQDPNIEVQLDGVGGTTLLVKAEVHRDGAMFPPFAFYHLIETEGFAKMASRLGWKSWGLPNYLVGAHRRRLRDIRNFLLTLLTGVPLRRMKPASWFCSLRRAFDTFCFFLLVLYHWAASRTWTFRGISYCRLRILDLQAWCLNAEIAAVVVFRGGISNFAHQAAVILAHSSSCSQDTYHLLQE